MPFSIGSPDPIGDVLAYIPVALALLAATIAIVPAGAVFLFEALARRTRTSRIPVVEPRPGTA
jgi:hypothetical protein